MPRPRYAFTFTLGPEDAEAVKIITHNLPITPTGAVKKAFLERLTLERAGWKLGDERIGAIRAIVGLDGKKLEKAIGFIETL